MFLNELDRCFNNDVIEKTFYNAPRGILRVKVETTLVAAKALNQVSMKLRRIRQISQINSSNL